MGALGFEADPIVAIAVNCHSLLACRHLLQALMYNSWASYQKLVAGFGSLRSCCLIVIE